jgi:SM-20-related protein
LADPALARDKEYKFGFMISVRILLHGGHVYETACPENAPMLDSLAEAISGAQGACGFAQLTIENGDTPRGLAIPASAILAVETNPPASLRWQPKSRIELTPYIRIPDFLSEEENRAVFDYAIGKEPDYEASQVETGVKDYRCSRVLMRLDDLVVDFDERIHDIVSDALSYFRFPVPVDLKLEMQLSTHNDGGYFRIHNDNSSPRTASRVLTYIYYFHRQPVAFKGGQLRLYDSRIESSRRNLAHTFIALEPENNMLLLFPSRVMHEVLPTYCSSGNFADGRFTLNGWVRNQWNPAELTTRKRSNSEASDQEPEEEDPLAHVPS